MSDETVRLTYGELAARRGISLAAARRLTLRRRWSKQIGNDGKTRVIVPASAAMADATPAQEPPADPTTVQALADALTDAMRVVPMLECALAAERERADRAEHRARVWEEQIRGMQETIARLVERTPPVRRSWWRRR